jgi:proteasome-associated ATPase
MPQKDEPQNPAPKPAPTREQLVAEIIRLRKKLSDLATVHQAQILKAEAERKRADQLDAHRKATDTLLEQMQEQLSSVRAELADALTQLQQIAGVPRLYGTVLSTDREGTVDILDGGKRKKVRCVREINRNLLVPGTRVLISSQNGAVLDIVSPAPEPAGERATFLRKVGPLSALVRVCDSNHPVVPISERFDHDQLRKDREVLLENGMLVGIVAEESGRDRFSSKYALASPPDATFADIGGLDEVLEEIRDGILGPYEHPERYRKYGEPAQFNALLIGPPGVGKTMIAKAIANKLMERFRALIEKHARGNFFAINGPELLNKWLGNTEEAIRAIHDGAQALHDVTGAPVVVFIDDCDAFLRGRGTGHYDGGAHESFVTQFLTILDGIKGSQGVCYILASNRDDILDAALKDRVHAIIRVPPPTNPRAASEIFRKHLRGIPFAEATDTEGDPVYNATLADGYIERLVEELFRRTPDTAVLTLGFADREDVETLYCGDLLSGRKISHAIRRAKRLALKRDEMLGDPEAISGVTFEDLQQAVREKVLDSNDYPRSMRSVQAWLAQRGEEDEIEWFENLRTRSRLRRKRREKLAKKVQ